MSIQNTDTDSAALEKTSREGLGLTIGDVYRGDPLGALLSADETIVEAHQERNGMFTLTEVGDTSNGAWMQSLDTVEIKQ